MTTPEQHVREHYDGGVTVSTVLEALTAAGVDPSTCRSPTSGRWTSFTRAGMPRRWSSPSWRGSRATTACSTSGAASVGLPGRWRRTSVAT